MSFEDLPKVKLLPMLQSGFLTGKARHSETCYFDTPERDLWKSGFSLRVRKIDRDFIQTVKLETSSSIKRGEWESKIDRAAPELAIIDHTPLADVLNARIRQNLKRAFQVDVERTSFLLDARDAEIEVALDQGQIRTDPPGVAAAKSEALNVCELELELKRGDAAAAFALARVLATQAPLRLSVISKAERGHLLAEGAFGRPAKASKPRISADMTGPQAFKAICRACLHDFMLNEAGLETPDAAEAVHQGRIAVRRLRACLSLFKPIIRDDAYPKIRADLNWISRIFGLARDLDVMRPAPKAASQPEIATLSEFSGWIEAGRLAAHQTVRDAVGSLRWRIFMIDLTQWIENREGRPHERLDAMPSFVRTRLKKRLDSLVRKGRRLEKLDSESRHKVRIEAKNLKYMTEFFLDVPSVAASKPRGNLIFWLDGLQSALGKVRDEEARAAAVDAAMRSWRSGSESLDRTAIPIAKEWTMPQCDVRKQMRKAVQSYSKL